MPLIFKFLMSYFFSNRNHGIKGYFEIIIFFNRLPKYKLNKLIKFLFLFSIITRYEEYHFLNVIYEISFKILMIVSYLLCLVICIRMGVRRARVFVSWVLIIFSTLCSSRLRCIARSMIIGFLGMILCIFISILVFSISMSPLYSSMHTPQSPS